MSLIPNESYSFPEEFTQTIIRPRNLREKKTAPMVKPEAPREKSFPPPNGSPRPPQEKNSLPPSLQEPENIGLGAPLPVAFVRESLPQPQTNPVTETPDNSTPAASVSLEEFMRILQASAQTIEVEPPAPSPPVAPALDQELNFELFQQDPEQLPEKRRRRAKFRRFFICEAVVVAVLIPSASVGLARTFSDPTLVVLINILTIASAVLAALIPIMFFALSPALPRDESINRI